MSKKSSKQFKTLWTSTIGLPKWNQSPIDINQMYIMNRKLPPLYMKGHISKEGTAKMTNTGTTVKIEFEGGRPSTVYGGPLGDIEYQFIDMQFRWGPNNVRGAEHSIEGVWFTMEAQATHWNTSYGSIEKCMEKEDGFCIIAFLLQVIGCPSMIDNPNFTSISKNLHWIKTPDKSVEIPRDCVCWMQDACTYPGYYTYDGSFTTPPHSECVKWIVIPRPIRISSKQADAFRSIYDYKLEHITHNYRSQHRVHQRKIYYVKEDCDKK